MNTKIIFNYLFLTSFAVSSLIGQNVTIDQSGNDIFFTIKEIPNLQVNPAFTPSYNPPYNAPFYDIFISFGDGNKNIFERHHDTYGVDVDDPNALLSFKDTIIHYTYSYQGNFEPIITFLERKHDPPPPTLIKRDTIEVSQSSSPKAINNVIDPLKKIKVEINRPFLKQDHFIEVVVSYKPEEEGNLLLFYDDEYLDFQNEQKIIQFENHEQIISDLPIDVIYTLNKSINVKIGNEDKSNYISPSGEELRRFFYFKCKKEEISKKTQIVAVLTKDSCITPHGNSEPFWEDIPEIIILGTKTLNLWGCHFLDGDRGTIDAREPKDPNSLTLLKDYVLECNDDYYVYFDFFFRNIGPQPSETSYVSIYPKTSHFRDIKPLWLMKEGCFQLASNLTPIGNGLNPLTGCPGRTFSVLNGVLNQNCGPFEFSSTSSEIQICIADLNLRPNEYAVLRFSAKIEKNIFIENFYNGNSFFRVCQVFLPTFIHDCVSDKIKCKNYHVGHRNRSIPRHIRYYKESCFDNINVLQARNCFKILNHDRNSRN